MITYFFLDMGYPIPYDNHFSDEKPVTTEENYKEWDDEFFKFTIKNI